LDVGGYPFALNVVSVLCSTSEGDADLRRHLCQSTTAALLCVCVGIIVIALEDIGACAISLYMMLRNNLFYVSVDYNNHNRTLNVKQLNNVMTLEP